MTKDFSSMSEDEKKGYLMALGFDSSKLGEDPPEKKPENRTAEERTISVEKKKFSRRERSLLQKVSARIWGALSVAFHGILRAAFVSAEVGEQVVVRIRPRKRSKPLNPLSVREAIRAGLKPHLSRSDS